MVHDGPQLRGDEGRGGTSIRVGSPVLGTCTRTVRRLIWRGELRSVRVGRLVRVEVAALRAYVESRR